MYLYNKNNKNQQPTYVDDKTFLQNLSNPEYRFSKTSVRQCIQNMYTIHGQTNLITARLLLINSLDLRKKVVKFCPLVASKWTKEDKNQHVFFEQCLNDIISELDKVINTFSK